MIVINHLHSKATVAETADIAKSISTATADAAVDDAYLNGANQTLDSKVTTMVAGFGVGRGKDLRNELFDADLFRDDLLSAIILILKGYLKWNKAGKVEAAGTLLDAINNHGKGIIHLTIENESAKLDSILNIFDEPEKVAAIEMVNLSELCADLKAAQASLKAIYQQSAQIESEKSEILSPSAVKNDTQNQLNKVIDYLNAMVDVDGAKYGALASKIAQFIDDLNMKIKIRTSAPKEKTEVVLNT